MHSAATTHTEVPSLRRVYRSRALRSAVVSSGACSDPAWTCDRPREERTKTSYSGHETSTFCSDIFLGSNQVTISSVCFTTRLFFGVGSGCLTHPRAFFMRGATVLHALDVAGAVALDDGFELIPVQLAKVVVAAFFVPLQTWVWQGQAQGLGLWNNHVHEALAQLIV